MGGICGICRLELTPERGEMDAMLAVLAGPNALSGHSISASGFVAGMAQCWPHQQLAGVGKICVAVDADLVNLDTVLSLAGQPEMEPTKSLAHAIAALYLARGTEFLNLLRGAFSLALWDEQQQRLLLAIDPLGVRNLYWSIRKGAFYFASRSSAVLAAQDQPAEVNPAALVNFLILSAVPAPLSIYRGVERLRPGYFVTYQHGQVRQQSYWDIQYQESHNDDERHWAAAVRNELRQAVRVTAAGCQPERTGAYLSGGTDSSTVVAFLNEAQPPANSFSVWFADRRYSEIGFARTTAEAFHTRHFEKCVSPKDAEEAIPKLLAYYDEPFANSSAVGAYWCARLAREQGIDTLLAGDGGDELFAGNERYASDKIFQTYNSLPLWLRKLGIETASSLLPHASLPRRFIRRAHIANPRRMFSRTLFLSMSPEEVFEPWLLREAPVQRWLEIPEAHFARPDVASELNRMMYLDLKITLADNDLPKVVGTAELAGVRVRFPLLDRQLVEFSGTIPSRLKMKGWEKRYIFKQAMGPILPHSILYKKKHGFGVPLGKWLLESQGLNSLVSDILSDSRTRQRGYFRSGFLDRLRELHRGPHAGYYGEIIWYLLVLEFWHRHHLNRAKGAVIAN